MRLTQRLLASSLLVVAALVALAVAAVQRRVVDAARTDAAARVRGEASVAARAWRAGAAPAPLADSLAAALGRHVTLVDLTGRVVGDSEERDPGRPALRRYAELPEVRAALRGAEYAAHAGSPSAGTPVPAAAARGPAGVVRVAARADPAPLAASLRRAVLLAGVAALGLAALLSVVFARHVVRPIVELRDVTRALAAGDLSRRPALSAPGEVGDLATAVRGLAEQLGARQAALRAEEELMTAVAEALTEGVVAIDADRRVVRVNGFARRLFRLRDPVPFPADQLPDERGLRDALGHALGGTATGPVEVRVGDRTLSLTARPLGAGGAGGAVLAFYDLTQTRRLEAVRRDFVANVSHELKTPLTIVGGFAETIVDDDHLPAPQRRQFAEAIRSNAARMQRIVDDLLDLSRIESGGWRPVPTIVDVGQAVRDATAAAARAAEQKGVVLELLVADAPTIWADPTAVGQILSNLVENAIRHTAAGTVTVFTRRHDARGVWLGVRDTGAGIPRVHLPRIFERFYRADPGRSREAGGTGLGLAIVKHLADAHGGSVRADSTVGRGTVIEVLFPDGLTDVDAAT